MLKTTKRDAILPSPVQVRLWGWVEQQHRHFPFPSIRTSIISVVRNHSKNKKLQHFGGLFASQELCSTHLNHASPHRNRLLDASLSLPKPAGLLDTHDEPT